MRKNKKSIVDNDRSMLQPIRDEQYYKEMESCSHFGMYFYNEYFNLYHCPSCNSFWIPTKKLKHGIKFSYAHVDFSRNDDRIMNVWCEDLVRMQRNAKLSAYEKRILKQQTKMYARSDKKL